jgi:DNA repair exonuclease SbcCD ATPase subunit
MIPKRIVLENFLSFGTPATAIEFGDDEPLWVLGGPNGVGKSAVFDAMTYALYGEHRGGASEHTCLVRHGANEFRVIFEFEFNGTNYQITRNRPRSGRPTQGIKEWSGGGWNQTVQLPAVTGRQDAIKVWAERTLGIPFAAFKASVLLRQGESDAIITAGGTERLNTLKKIIGLEKYEKFSERVHGASRKRKEAFDDLCTKRDGVTPVTEEEVVPARNDFAQKEEQRTKAQDAVTEAVERVPLANEWGKLKTDAVALKRQIRDADVRAADEAQIRADYTRLTDLMTVVPVLRQVVTLRGQLSEATEALAKLQEVNRQHAKEIDRLTAVVEQEKQKADKHRTSADDAAREAKRLREDIGRIEKWIPTASEVATLKTELARFPSNLAEQLEEAKKKVQTAAEALTSAGQTKAKIVGFLDEAKGQQRKFATVGVGVPCSLCGQKVTEEHADAERTRLGERVQDLEGKLRDAQKDENTANDEKIAAEKERTRLDRFHQQQSQKSERYATLRKALDDLGVTADADELRNDVAAKKVDAASHEQKAGREEQGRQFAEAEASRLEKERQKLAKQFFADLGAEQQRLETSDVARLFKQLEEDTARRKGWREQLDKMKQRLKEVRGDARIPVGEAENQLKAARKAASDAELARDAARKKADDLAAAAENFRKLVEDIGIAEKQKRTHEKLDDLLGKCGLQRELVRTAERKIVRLANDTVQNLSDGDLTVELDGSADGDNEAFALRVRRADDPTPIGVSYLSGSQKFRVAVSVALAIGRFAAGQARPLESVIIDEGFGSLDRDGLRAAAEELNRLRQHLRRIVVVSHQEEFAKRFPVVIQLTGGENGTTAAPVRQGS